MLVAQAAIAGEVFPSVLVAPSPLKPYVDELLRGHASAHSLLNPGQDAHHFALSPSQAAQLDKADVLVVANLAMSPSLQKLASKKKLRVIDLSSLPGADPLPYAKENPWLTAQKANDKTIKEGAHSDHDHDHDHDHNHNDHASKPKGKKQALTPSPAIDPHLWLDPIRMATLAAPLADELGKSAPEALAEMKINAATLARHLREEVTPNIIAMLGATPRTTNTMTRPEIPFITYHAAYQYFTDRFGLEHYGELTQRPEELMGAKTAKQLMERAEKIRVRCLIGEQENRLMQMIAQRSGAKIVLLSPEQLPTSRAVDTPPWVKNEYDRFLYHTAATFAQCL
jgi:zinc transport system substrate-binding protein